MRRLVPAVLLVSMMSLPVFPQKQANLEQGLKPYGSYQGGNIDSISLTNGNLTLHAPLVSYPQRGRLTMDFFLRYNNKGWQVVASDDGFGNEVRVWTWKGSGVEIVRDQSLGLEHRYIRVQPLHDPLGNPVFVHFYDAVSSDGSSHQLEQTSYGLMSVDGSGIVENGSVLIDRSGIRYGAAIEDPNGNKITVSSSAGWTDTLGRLIPGSTPSNNNYGLKAQGKLLPGVPTTNYASCPTGTVAARLWNMPGPTGTATIKMCYGSFTLTPSFGIAGITQPPVTDRLMTAVVLPNGTKWLFAYNTFGDLTQITLPTGGTISYAWTTKAVCGTPINLTPVNRVVSSRTVNANDGTGAKTWNYAWGTQGGPNTVTDPANNDTLHYPVGVAGSCSIFVGKTEQYQGTGGTRVLLKTVETTYTGNPDPRDIYEEDYTSINVVEVQTRTIWPTGQVSETTATYDSGNTFTFYDAYWDTYSTHPLVLGSVLQSTESNFGSGAPGPILRKTINQYVWQTNNNYKSRNMLNLVAWTRVQADTGNHTSCSSPAPVACTTFAYDETTPAATGITTQHAVPPAVGSYRGNLTSASRWLNTTGGLLTSTTAYWDTGMVKEAKDPLQHPTSYVYSTSFAGAYPTQVTNAAGHIATTNYNWNTGLVTSATDPNNQSTTFSYDNMWRLIQANAPDGGQTTFAYTSSVPFKVTVTAKITASMNLVEEGEVDGLGRTKQTRLLSDPQGVVYVDTTYDALGRVKTVTNPYRSTSDPTYGITETQYDALGRVSKVIPPDGTAASNNITTVYSGNSITVTDQQGKQRRSFADALGRLIQVDEPNPTLSTPAVTTYTYDVLDNLLTVLQSGSRQRTFTYNSLSQLTQAVNPESGTISYTYDNDGNLLTKISPRPNQTNPAVTVTASHTYDALHRLTVKSYSDGTPSVFNTYDNSGGYGFAVDNAVGRLVAAERPCHSIFYVKYDPLGRVKQENQFDPIDCGSTGKVLTYTYDLAGNMTSYTNGVGVTFTQTFDAASRLTQVTSNLVDVEHPATLASGFTYHPHGAVNAMAYGNGLAETHAFNNRLQPTELRTYNPGTGSDTAKFTYGFYDGSGQNNGNVMSMVGQGTGITNFNRSYTYDELTRLKTMAGTGGACTGLGWTYDIWGNRTNQTPTGGTCNPSSLAFDANNRITGAGYQYDAAGNITFDPTTGSTLTYDAENRMISVSGTLGNVSYVYDALGRRTAKQPAGGDRTRFIYDLAGNVVAEWFSGSWTGWGIGYVYVNGQMLAQYRDGTTYFALKDHLGSTRAMTRLNQSVLASYDYLPFGEESGGPYPTTHKFTGKERDSESDLDYFVARYYSNKLGRFMTPDWAAAPTAVPYADFGDPQSLNLYTYVGNNPITRFDADGHCWPIGECAKAFQNAVSAATDKLFNAAAGSGNVVLAAAIGTAGDIVNGAADAFRAGEAVGACVDSCSGVQMADAVSQDLNRTAGLVAMAAGGGEAVVEKVTQRALTKAATEALDTVGPGKGAVHGTRVHTQFGDKVESASRRLGTTKEVSYKNGVVVPRGTPGSVRVDAVRGNPARPQAVYDLKTGGAKLTPARRAQIQKDLPRRTTIKEIRPAQ